VTLIGYHASHEQHSPSALLAATRAAADAGFGAISSSDHLSPWSRWCRSIRRPIRTTAMTSPTSTASIPGWGHWASSSRWCARPATGGCAFVAVHNFGAEPCRLELPLDGIDDAVAADDLLDGSWVHPLDEPVLHLTLDGYGYQWLRIRRAGQRLSPLTRRTGRGAAAVATDAGPAAPTRQHGRP
jgi:hypothetical protein